MAGIVLSHQRVVEQLLAVAKVRHSRNRALCDAPVAGARAASEDRKLSCRALADVRAMNELFRRTMPPNHSPDPDVPAVGSNGFVKGSAGGRLSN